MRRTLQSKLPRHTSTPVESTTSAWVVNRARSGSPLIIIGYLLATVGALLLGRDPVLRLLGVVAGLGAVACALLWRMEFVSAWCALAAVASVVLFRWVRRRPAGPGTALAQPFGAAPAEPRTGVDTSGWPHAVRVPARRPRARPAKEEDP